MLLISITENIDIDHCCMSSSGFSLQTDEVTSQSEKMQGE